MQVKMIKATNWNGYREVDTVHEVPSDIARRWQSKGIALLLSKPSIEEDIKNEPVSSVRNEPAASGLPRANFKPASQWKQQNANKSK